MLPQCVAVTQAAAEEDNTMQLGTKDKGQQGTMGDHGKKARFSSAILIFDQPRLSNCNFVPAVTRLCGVISQISDCD